MDIEPILRWKYNNNSGIGDVMKFIQGNVSNTTLKDDNVYIINMYKVIKYNPELLIEELENYRELTKENYYEVREEWNKYLRKKGTIKQAAAFIYLNRTCFRGYFLINNSGQFITKYGNNMKAKIYSKENILKVSEFLRKNNIMFE